MNATWDQALLRIELDDLAQLGMADLTGFSETELREFGIGVEALGGMPVLADGEHSPFQQMTFILHGSAGRDRIAGDRRAHQRARGRRPRPTENKNQNGNALAEICRAYLGAHATS